MAAIEHKFHVICYSTGLLAPLSLIIIGIEIFICLKRRSMKKKNRTGHKVQ